MLIIKTNSAYHDGTSQKKAKYLSDSEVTYDNIIRFAKELKNDMPPNTYTTLEMHITDFCKLINEAKDCGRKEACEFHVGDEVEFIARKPNCKLNEVMTGYVLGFVSDLSSECSVRILTKHGTYLKSHEMCEKTGKHNPDIEKVMASFEKGEKDD